MSKPTTLTKRNRNDFIGRIHRKLGWGWEIWSEDGYDVITPCNRFYEIFELEPGITTMVQGNRLWLPASTLKSDTDDVVRGRFRINGETAIRMALKPEYDYQYNYSSMSAVYAHTFNEFTLRTKHALRQRKAWKRWYNEQVIRIRVHPSELTTARIDMLGAFVEQLNACPSEQYPVLPYNTTEDAGYHLRLAFIQLEDNPVLQYYWNDQCLAGLRYVRLINNWAALYTSRFCIINVGRNSEEAESCSIWVERNGLPYIPHVPTINCLTHGYVDEKAGRWYPK